MSYSAMPLFSRLRRVYTALQLLPTRFPSGVPHPWPCFLLILATAYLQVFSYRVTTLCIISALHMQQLSRPWATKQIHPKPVHPHWTVCQCGEMGLKA